MENNVLIRLQFNTQTVINLHTEDHGLERVETRNNISVFSVKQTLVSDFLYDNIKKQHHQVRVMIKMEGVIRDAIVRLFEKTDNGYRMALATK